MIRVPEHAPFTDSEREALSKLMEGWGAEQRLWLSGFLAGAPSGGGGAGASSSSQSLVVLYGTESGNSESLAARTAKEAKSRGLKVQTVNMSESVPADLAKAENLLVIVSTWGEGDPPEAAEDYYKKFLALEQDLSGVKFSVCALGDTSYEHFCQIGKEFDERLEKLGASRVAPRVDCDVDFEEAYAGWSKSALDGLGGSEGAAEPAAIEPAPTVEYGKKNPFPAELLDKVLLSASGSKKETWHFELNLAGSGLEYEVGDALAVVPTNAADVVDNLLKAAGLSGEEVVETKKAGSLPLKEALTSHYDITALSRKVAKTWQGHSGSEELAALLDDSNKEAFKDWIWGRQIVDLLVDYPAKEISAQDLVNMFRPLPPRLYSIASSPREHEGEVHLTVAAVRYDGHGKTRKGVASTCLADLVETGDSVPVFVTPNKRFRLPDNDDAPIIMVGPGTGVAPFRAFVEDRGVRGAKGKNWLIFGDQCYTHDFLYQLEWQDHLASGALTHLDVAFSRDQPEKVYVQDRIRENGAAVWKWLQEGAVFYVCGDASRMAPDVHAALLDVIASEGGMDAEKAEEYLNQMKKDGRYQRDVY